MKISTRARYGTRAMLDLAMNYGQGPVMVKDIAARQQVSPRYLEQLLFAVKLAGLVKSVRGIRGGFMLARPPSKIKLLQVVEALDGSIAPVSCVDQPEQYIRSPYCAAHDVWSEVKKAAEVVLDSLTLEDLAIKQKHKEKEARETGAEALKAICGRCGEDIYGLKS